MSEISYKVGELRRVIKESSQKNEFDPKFGPHVERDDQKNAQDAYKRAKERAQNYDGGLKTPEKRELNPRMTGNKTMLGLDYDDEPNDKFKERVKAQVKGYSNDLEEDNGIEKSGDFNDEWYENEKETVEMMAKDKENIRTAGLVSSKLKEKDPEYGKVHTAFQESKAPIKRLTYHHTKFVNESQIFTKIPEDFKVDGNRFIVRDATDSEYLIEWCIDKKNNISEGRILNERNLKEADKTIDRMAELMGYNSSNIFGRGSSRSTINENKNVENMLNNIRQITD